MQWHRSVAGWFGCKRCFMTMTERCRRSHWILLALVPEYRNLGCVGRNAGGAARPSPHDVLKDALFSCALVLQHATSPVTPPWLVSNPLPPGCFAAASYSRWRTRLSPLLESPNNSLDAIDANSPTYPTIASLPAQTSSGPGFQSQSSCLPTRKRWIITKCGHKW